MVAFDLYLPRRRRIATASPFQMTSRDIAVVEAIHRYRMLERRQVESLFFQKAPGQRTNTNRSRERLRLLYQHGYLERVPRPIHPSQGSKGPVYRLGVNGAKFLAKRAEVSLSQFHYWGRGDDKDARQTRVQPMFLEHGIALADIRIAVEQSAKRQGLTIELWRDEMEFRHPQEKEAVNVALSPDTQKERIPIMPDGYFVLISPRGRAHFFLEMDRSTETIRKTWQRKIVGYKEYILGGKFHQQYGVAWPQTPLRILTATISIDRAQHLKAAAERYGPLEAAQMFLFAPFSELTEMDALTAPMWLRAGATGRQALL